MRVVSRHACPMAKPTGRAPAYDPAAMHHSCDLVQTDCPTPLGRMQLAASALGLCGAWFEDQKHRPLQLDGIWPHDAGHAVLAEACAQLQAYFTGRLHRFELTLDLSSGTAFQQAVWRHLTHIAYGQRCSYGDLARQLGCPLSVRATAAAIGRNPLSIVLPCHRVVGSAGQLTGYAGGLHRKRALLELEGGLA